MPLIHSTNIKCLLCSGELVRCYSFLTTFSYCIAGCLTLNTSTELLMFPSYLFKLALHFFSDYIYNLLVVIYKLGVVY